MAPADPTDDTRALWRLQVQRRPTAVTTHFVVSPTRMQPNALKKRQKTEQTAAMLIHTFMEM